MGCRTIDGCCQREFSELWKAVQSLAQRGSNQVFPPHDGAAEDGALPLCAFLTSVIKSC